MSNFQVGQPVFVYPDFAVPYLVIDKTPAGHFCWIKSRDGKIHFVRSTNLEPLRMEKQTTKHCLHVVSFNPHVGFSAELSA